jgi:hypothetical protein
LENNIEELLILVKELTDIYTSKESTSITYEAAQQLMNAVLYCIRENELEPENSDQEEAVVAPERYFPTTREAYDNGYRLVVDKIRKANEIYNNIIIDFMDYGNRAYYDTVVKGIPEFFKWYDPRLNPMNHIILVDYPVLVPLYNFEGVDLIYRYLICIQMEQKFLKQFPQDYVRELLIHNHSDYEELLINLCGVLLKKVLVNLLIGEKVEKIKYEAADYEKLSEIIRGMKKEELEGKLYCHLQRLINNIYSGDNGLYRYLSNEILNISTELRNAESNNCLFHTI